MHDVTGFPDPRPRRVSAAAPQPAQCWYRWAAALREATGSRVGDDAGAALSDGLAHALVTAPEQVESAIDQAPSPEIALQLWTTVANLWQHREAAHEALQLTGFALPIIVIAGLQGESGATDLPGQLEAPERLAGILGEGGALGGTQAIAIGPMLVGAAALGFDRRAAWRALARLPSAAVGEPLFVPAPLAIAPGTERVYLRFLIGTALASADRDVFADAGVHRWGAKLTADLVRQLTRPGTTVLPLPRAPAPPLPAAYDGWAAQREVSAQLFATNAIRKLRAAVGEPTAVISAHAAADAPGGGELRLSLSSSFEPREAEGFRCPIHAIEPVALPLGMLVDLLRDCRVEAVRLAAGVHPDRLPDGTPLFFKPETIPSGALLQ